MCAYVCLRESELTQSVRSVKMRTMLKPPPSSLICVICVIIFRDGIFRDRLFWCPDRTRCLQTANSSIKISNLSHLWPNTPMKTGRCIHVGFKWALTDASLMLPSPAASLAILLMIGETLVGPYSWILGRQFWYASTTPWISDQKKAE